MWRSSKLRRRWKPTSSTLTKGKDKPRYVWVQIQEIISMVSPKPKRCSKTRATAARRPEHGFTQQSRNITSLIVKPPDCYPRNRANLVFIRHNSTTSKPIPNELEFLVYSLKFGTVVLATLRALWTVSRVGTEIHEQEFPATRRHFSWILLPSRWKYSTNRVRTDRQVGKTIYLLRTSINKEVNRE